VTSVLLTGASGFVGRQVLAALRTSGYSVRTIARAHRSLPKGIERVETKDLFRESLEWWTDALDGIDTVIHCAWFAEPGRYLESENNYDCLSGSITMAQAALQTGVKRFVGVGTCFEYDLSQRVLSIETPLVPQTPYAASKAATFLVMSQVFRKSHVSFAWARLFYMYGEGEDDRRLVPYIRKQLAKSEPALLTEGWQIRDYMNVEEVGRRLADLGLATHVQGPVNICSGRPQTVRDMAIMIGREYGREDLLHFGARPMNMTDPDCVLGVPTTWNTE
jgi:nucleoside-diphosphate-sugar epimerase